MDFSNCKYVLLCHGQQGIGLQGQEREVNDSSTDTNQPKSDHISVVQVDPGHVSFCFPRAPLLRPFQQATVCSCEFPVISTYMFHLCLKNKVSFLHIIHWMKLIGGFF